MTKKRKKENGNNATNLPAATSAELPVVLDPAELQKATQVAEDEIIWLGNTTKGFDWQGQLIPTVQGRTLGLRTGWLAFVDGKRGEMIPFSGDLSERPTPEHKLRGEYQLLTPDGYKLGIRFPEYSYKKFLAPYLKSVVDRGLDLSEIAVQIECSRKVIGELTFAVLTITELGEG